MMFSSQVCARSVMHEPSADWPCQPKTPSSWLHVITVPRRTMSTCRARRQGEPSDHAVERSGGPLTVAAAHREQEAVAGRVARRRAGREVGPRADAPELAHADRSAAPPSSRRDCWVLVAPGSPSSAGKPPPSGRRTGRPRPPSISAAACGHRRGRSISGSLRPVALSVACVVWKACAPARGFSHGKAVAPARNRSRRSPS